jgi:hypothetical protein
LTHKVLISCQAKFFPFTTGRAKSNILCCALLLREVRAPLAYDMLMIRASDARWMRASYANISRMGLRECHANVTHEIRAGKYKSYVNGARISRGRSTYHRMLLLGASVYKFLKNTHIIYFILFCKHHKVRISISSLLFRSAVWSSGLPVWTEYQS